ncbi:MAG: 4Fe-4S dicluster domain-containing protein [Candidatus Omnitrophota bacterium]
METYFLKQEDLQRFYQRIASEFQLFLPVKVNSPVKLGCEHGFNLPTEDYSLKEYSGMDAQNNCFNEYRCIEPVRQFFTHFKEEVTGYFSQQEPSTSQRPLAICGLKNCDLFALKILDYVFLGGNEPDPVYKQRRESALIISGDCPSFKESCFCRAFEINPFSEEGFDFNLSALNNGYLLDVSSPKAKAIAGALGEILNPASFGQLSGRQAKRDLAVRRLEEHLQYHKIPPKEVLKEIVLSGFNSLLWQEQARTCVECGGCIFICDTCHCFLLADEPQGGNYQRLRLWDGCLLKNFSRVAGGANPLKLRYMRLRNRYLKKFDFFVDNLGIQACCGCGRCIEACPGKIDIRAILKRLYDEKHLPAA